MGCEECEGFIVINLYCQNYAQARAGLTEHFEFYNTERFHHSLDNKTHQRFTLMAVQSEG